MTDSPVISCHRMTRQNIIHSWHHLYLSNFATLIRDSYKKLLNEFPSFFTQTERLSFCVISGLEWVQLLIVWETTSVENWIYFRDCLVLKSHMAHMDTRGTTQTKLCWQRIYHFLWQQKIDWLIESCSSFLREYWISDNLEWNSLNLKICSFSLSGDNWATQNNNREKMRVHE